jgi:predicted MFS family arabinose efflux permease
LSGLGAAEVESRLGAADRGRAFGMYVAALQIGGGVGVALNGILLSGLPAARIPLVASSLLVVLAAGLGMLSVTGEGRWESLSGLERELK